MSKKAHSKMVHKPVKGEFAFFLKAALIIILICLLCELFVFNMRHFVTYWAVAQIDMYSDKCQLDNIASDRQTGLFVPTGKAIIAFPNINKRVATVYIDAVFDENVKAQSFLINYGSEEHSNRTTSVFNVINGVEESKYVTLQPSGNVSHISIIYGTQNPTTSIRNIILNKPVPLKIFWPRVILFSIVAFCIVAIKRKKLFALPLMEDSENQKTLTAGIMLTFIAYLFLLMLFTAPFSLKRSFMKNFASDPRDQFNTEVVDAILDGHAYLNIEPTKEFLALKNPYDWEERIAANVNPPWDHAYYNGKFYSYFGIVPVLVLSLPVKLITGRYVSTRVAVFIFSALASVFLMLIWRRLVFRYMIKMPLGMYTLGQLTVAMCSMLSFLTVRPKFYEVAIASALFFTALGLWLILGSSAGKNTRWMEIAAGSLCMALAVGCRANYMVFLLLIPVVLFEELKEAWNDKKRFFSLCACVAVPCLFVASGLMWYNYIRFGSVLEFGSNYQITVSYIRANSFINPIAKLTKFLVGFFSYLTPSFRVSASFPFLYLNNIETGLAFKSYIYNTPTFGLIALPVVWFLFSVNTVKKVIDKKRKPILNLIIAMLCLGFLQLSVVVLSGGIVNRYCVDFFWLFVFSGLLCAYFIYEGVAEYQEEKQIQCQLSLNLRGMAGRVISTIMIISIILMFLVTLSGDGEGGALIWNNNPSIYYSIQRLLGFNTW
jgi:hypothetical protein